MTNAKKQVTSINQKTDRYILHVTFLVAMTNKIHLVAALGVLTFTNNQYMPGNSVDSTHHIFIYLNIKPLAKT